MGRRWMQVERMGWLEMRIYRFVGWLVVCLEVSLVEWNSTRSSSWHWKVMGHAGWRRIEWSRWGMMGGCLEIGWGSSLIFSTKISALDSIVESSRVRGVCERVSRWMGIDGVGGVRYMLESMIMNEISEEEANLPWSLRTLVSSNDERVFKSIIVQPSVCIDEVVMSANLITSLARWVDAFNFFHSSSENDQERVFLSLFQVITAYDELLSRSDAVTAWFESPREQEASKSLSFLFSSNTQSGKRVKLWIRIFRL